MQTTLQLLTMSDQQRTALQQQLTQLSQLNQLQQQMSALSGSSPNTPSAPAASPPPGQASNANLLTQLLNSTTDQAPSTANSGAPRLFFNTTTERITDPSSLQFLHFAVSLSLDWLSWNAHRRERENKEKERERENKRERGRQNIVAINFDVRRRRRQQQQH